MAYSVPGENLVPLSRAGTGLALVLGNDYTPLRVMQQGDNLAARRAAAEATLRQKQAQELARQWAEDRKLNLDTGGLFQQPFNDYTANAQEVLGKNFQAEQAGRLTTAQRIQANANYINDVTRERLLGLDKDKAIAAYETAQAANHFRDTQGLHAAIGQSVLNPDGSRVRAIHYDERGAIDKFEADPSTYAVDPILADYYKGLQASTLDEASAGRLGGVHANEGLTYKGLIPVKRADGSWDVKRDTLGRPVIGTTADELATARASNHNLNMAVSRLENEYAARRAADPSLPQRDALDLFQEASRKYVSFQQRQSVGRNAQPRAARGAGAAKTTVNANVNGEPGGVVPIAGNGQGMGYSSSYVFQAPTKTKVSTGQTEGYGYDGAQHSTYIRRVPGQDDELVTNSREPQNVQYDGGFLALVTPSGKIVRPPHGQQLNGQALYDFWRAQREANPRLTIEPIVNGSPRKGKNELGDREAVADQLQRSYDQAATFDPTKRPPTRAELLKKADEIVGKQNASYQFIYSDHHPLSEKRRIDGYAPGAFNSREKQAELQRALREADEATRPQKRRVADWGTGKVTPKGAVVGGVKTTGGKKVIKW